MKRRVHAPKIKEGERDKRHSEKGGLKRVLLVQPKRKDITGRRFCRRGGRSPVHGKKHSEERAFGS